MADFFRAQPTGRLTSYSLIKHVTGERASVVAQDSFFEPANSGDIQLTPAAGSIAITGYAPTVARTANQALNAGVGSVVITGYAPTVARTANQSLQLTQGAIAITGYAPTVNRTQNQSLTTAAGSIAIVGYAPSVMQAAPAIVPDFGISALIRDTASNCEALMLASSENKLAAMRGEINFITLMRDMAKNTEGDMSDSTINLTADFI